MAVFKCKMCGGSLEIAEGCSVAECEYCGTTQTVPSADNEKKMTLFTRANRLRFTCEFDKAAGIYESIIAEFPEEAEAYWGLVLCKYGIEYVDDPATAAKVPTCHRSAFESVLDDSNFELVMEYADSAACAVYRSEAKKIEELRKGIIEVSSKEEPYDIFICYKETDEKGDRTVDSLIAQDTYNALTEKGYRVFFSRITLEDKLGQEYEPYIFAALNSAKVMLAFGTCYEHFNAVWVKNEWSRFLQLMAKGEKKTLIPCYKNIDAYDIPKEFAKLQAQDMGKVGALQDLLRGIEKIIPLPKAPAAAEIRPTVTANTATVDSLLKRVEIFLGDKDWKSASEYCEKVLDIDPENAQAYLGELMAALRVSKKSELANCKLPFDTHRNYEKALRYGDKALVSELEGYIKHINTRNKEEQQSNAYNKARYLMQSANTEDGYRTAADAFTGILDYRDAADLRQKCFEKAKAARKDSILKDAKSKLSENSIIACEEAIELLKSITGWKDADDLAEKSKLKIGELKAKEEEAARQAELERAELARKAELERIEQEKKNKKNRKILIVLAILIIAAIGVFGYWSGVIVPNQKFDENAEIVKQYIEEEKLVDAALLITEMENNDRKPEVTMQVKEMYEDKAEALYQEVQTALDEKKYDTAYGKLEQLGDYKDSLDIYELLGNTVYFSGSWDQVEYLEQYCDLGELIQDKKLQKLIPGTWKFYNGNVKTVKFYKDGTYDSNGALYGSEWTADVWHGNLGMGDKYGITVYFVSHVFDNYYLLWDYDYSDKRVEFYYLAEKIK